MDNKRHAEPVHYAVPIEDVPYWIDASDYRKCPPKLCGNGSFHASWSYDWSKVTCDRCLELKED